MNKTHSDDRRVALKTRATIRGLVVAWFALVMLALVTLPLTVYADPSGPRDLGEDQADIGIDSISDSPDPVIAGNAVSYDVGIDNFGPENASNVVLSFMPDIGVSITSTSGCLEDPSGYPFHASLKSLPHLHATWSESHPFQLDYAPCQRRWPVHGFH